MTGGAAPVSLQTFTSAGARQRPRSAAGFHLEAASRQAAGSARRCAPRPGRPRRGRALRGWSRRAPSSRCSGRARALARPAIKLHEASQSGCERRTSRRPRHRRARRPRTAGRPDGADSPSPPARSPWPSSASLPWVRVGSGLPPSAQTSRSIISFSGDDA